MIGKRKLIGNVDDVASYTVSHNGTNVLHRGMSGSSIVDGVHFIGEETKGHIYRYLKTIEECINPAFYAQIVIERIAVKVAEFRGVPL